MKGNILIIEDDQDMCEMLNTGLGRRGFKTATFQNGAEGLASIDSERTDVILTDVNLPDINGIKICREIMTRTPEIPVVMMTAFGSLETAVDSLRAGAYDFITKPVDIDILALALKRAVQHRTLKQKLKVLSKAVKGAVVPDNFIGESPVMMELFDRLTRIAATETSVLITGESGCGKELTARSLHNHSRREEKPFIAINCSALPETLLESELFGHVKGAFTDAHDDRKGLFCEADGGTLFLDEVGDIPLSLQPKLLRAIEERSVRPIGSNQELPIDVRILSATNRDLESAVEAGTFREDLFYRLNVINIHIPPLRARGTDSLLIARSFISDIAARQGKQVKSLTEAAAKKILAYKWPGNVRELRNALEHAVALTNFDRITPEDLPDRVSSYRKDLFMLDTHTPAEMISLEEMVNRYIEYVLKATEGNQSLAAQILKVDRKTLYRKLQKTTP